MKKFKTKFEVDWHSHGAFTAYLPLPGYSRKYINVNVIDGVLSVHAFGSKYPAFCKKQTVASLVLPEHFRMPLKIEATFDNGLLTIFVQDQSILDGKIICVKIKKDKKLKPDDLKGLQSLKVGEIDGTNSTKSEDLSEPADSSSTE